MLAEQKVIATKFIEFFFSFKVDPIDTGSCHFSFSFLVYRPTNDTRFNENRSGGWTETIFNQNCVEDLYTQTLHRFHDGQLSPLEAIIEISPGT